MVDIYVGQESDCRNFLEAVFWITRSGSQWRLLPSSYGNWNTIYKRFARWSRLGVFARIFRSLAQPGRDSDTRMIDSTHLKAHRTAASLRKGGRDHAP